MEGDPIVSSLLLVPLDDLVVFPNMTVTIAVDVGEEKRVLLVPRHEGNYAMPNILSAQRSAERAAAGAAAR